MPDISASSSLLRRCGSWAEIRQALDGSSEAVKGAVFELLVKAYLTLDAKYDFKNVWSTHGETPKAVLTRLNLFNRDVTGIDLVAETRAGKFWAVQAKYHQDERRSLSREETIGLIAGRNRAHREFELVLICTTANGRSTNLADEPDLEFLMGDVWRGLGAEFFARFHAQQEGLQPPPPARKEPWPHQDEALAGIAGYFAGHSRGKVVMPCATGKSLIGFWAAEQLLATRALVAVPNLSLVRQLLTDWTEQSVAKGIRPTWAVVCSDETVADMTAARDLGVKVDTEPHVVANWLRSSKNADRSVVFTTYHSGPVLAAAAREAGAEFDVGIFDEAHRTAGREGAPFAHLLSDENIRIHKRIFMTATPRIYKGKDRDDIISMDDPEVFGGEAFKMTFLEAMDRKIIPNLTVLAVTIAEKEVERLLRHKQFVRLQAERGDEVIRAEDLVSALALRKAMKKYRIRRTLGFYSSRKLCRLAREVQRLVGELFPEYGPLDVFHVEGDMTSGERDLELRAFERSEHALLTNVRVFVEGVDCPSMDAVMFAGPRQSVIDIVQGVGRALRPHPGKSAGYAIIPTVIQDDGSPSDEAYEQVVRVVCALGSENELILAYFAAIARGETWKGRRVFEVLGDLEVGLKIDAAKVNQAIAVRTYRRTVDWRPFVEAREFVRRLGLRSGKRWSRWVRSAARPPDIPSDPSRVYAGEFVDWPNWLGYESWRRARGTYRSFDDAREFVRALGLHSIKEWNAWTTSPQRAWDIPRNPPLAYRKQFKSWPDWLGYEPNNFLPFEEARDLVRGLGLRSVKEWNEWAISKKRPLDIPSNPASTYQEQFKGWSDWLGFEAKDLLPFEQARDLARGLGIRSVREWKQWSLSNARPLDLPADPSTTYLGEFKSWADWLGHGADSQQPSVLERQVPRPIGCLSFDDARTYVRRLELRSESEWDQWARSTARRSDIPSEPARVYAVQFKNWPDWLGPQADFRETTRLASQGPVRGTWKKGGAFRSFGDARTYVRGLGLTSTREWLAWAQSSARPKDIPSSPMAAYRGDYKGMPDWLGTTDKRSDKGGTWKKGL